MTCRSSPVGIDASDVMAEVGKTGTGNETHITSPDDTYIHHLFSPCMTDKVSLVDDRVRLSVATAR